MQILSKFHAIKFFLQPKGELYFSLKQILGFRPHNLHYYQRALTHKSLCKRDQTGHFVHNERLEYLGDAIIEAVVSDILYKKYKQAREGFLTELRSKIVQRSSLNSLAERIGLSKLIQFSLSRDTHNNDINGNAFEAFVGAIYLDRGYKYAYRFMQKLITDKEICVESTARKTENFKSILLERCQKMRMHITFDTQNIPPTDENGEKQFFTRVIIEDMKLGTGQGFTKRESHQKAAQKTLILLSHRPQIVHGLHRRRLQRLCALDLLHDFKQG